MFVSTVDCLDCNAQRNEKFLSWNNRSPGLSKIEKLSNRDFSRIFASRLLISTERCGDHVSVGAGGLCTCGGCDGRRTRVVGPANAARLSRRDAAEKGARERGRESARERYVGAREKSRLVKPLSEKPAWLLDRPALRSVLHCAPCEAELSRYLLALPLARRDPGSTLRSRSRASPAGKS